MDTALLNNTAQQRTCYMDSSLKLFSHFSLSEYTWIYQTNLVNRDPGIIKPAFQANTC